MMGDEPGWCRRHSYDHRGATFGVGVCPSCLHDRLLLLCPECAQVRPCPCRTWPSLLSFSPTGSSSASSSSSSDLAASVGGGGRRSAKKEESGRGGVRRSGSVRVAGDVLSGGGKGGGLKWLDRVFSMAARAFGGQRKTAEVDKEQPDDLQR